MLWLSGLAFHLLFTSWSSYCAPQKASSAAAFIKKSEQPFLNKDSLDWLDSQLAVQSYVHGYLLSAVDVIVANHINELPTSYVHVNRWFKHVTNQEDKPSEIAKLPKNVKSDLLAHFGSLFSCMFLNLNNFFRCESH